MEYYSVIKKKREWTTDTGNKRDGSQKRYAKWKKSYKKVNTVSSHLYEILEQSKLSYSGKKSEVVVSKGQKWGLNAKVVREHSGVMAILYLDRGSGDICIIKIEQVYMHHEESRVPLTDCKFYIQMKNYKQILNSS